MASLEIIRLSRTVSAATLQLAAPAHAAAACPPPSDKSLLPLVVYYQVVQPQDREPASRIGFEMPADFPSAGTEYVPQKNPGQQQPQVRFYYADEEKAAEYLARLLNDAYTHVLNRAPVVPFKTVSIAGKCNNLSPKLVGVWFSQRCRRAVADAAIIASLQSVRVCG